MSRAPRKARGKLRAICVGRCVVAEQLEEESYKLASGHLLSYPNPKHAQPTKSRNQAALLQVDAHCCAWYWQCLGLASCDGDDDGDGGDGDDDAENKCHDAL